MTNVKRLGRYHNLYTSKNNNDDSSSQTNSNELTPFYKDNNRKPLVDWNKPLFGNKRTSLQKLLAKANKTTERATKFINKIRSRQLACVSRAKSIPENATIITMLIGKTLKAKKCFGDHNNFSGRCNVQKICNKFISVRLNIYNNCNNQNG